MDANKTFNPVENRNSLEERVTNRIIAALEQGLIPWNKPWTNGRSVTASYKNVAYNRVTLKAYSGINQMLLKAGEWATFKQWTEEGGRIKKGAKGEEIIYWARKQYVNEVKDSNGNVVTENGKPKTEVRNVWILKSYYVFHIDSVDGVEPKKLPRKKPQLEFNPDAEQIIKDYQARENLSINYGGDKAFYRPAADDVTVPAIDQYKNKSEYYSTLFHELTHSTGHEKRLNRGFEHNAAFGSEEYSREELVAEIGACGILNTLGIEDKTSFRNSTAYIQAWTRALKNDKSWIIWATAKADKAIEYILTGNK